MKRKPAPDLQELRRVARANLKHDVSPLNPGADPLVRPVAINWNLNGETMVCSGGVVIESINLEQIKRVSTEHHRLIRVLLELLSQQACIAADAVILANLQQGHHDPQKSVDAKRINAEPRNDLLCKRAIELLSVRRFRSYDDMGRRLADKYPDEYPNTATLAKRLARLLGR